jgi:hypothetical protein
MPLKGRTFNSDSSELKAKETFARLEKSFGNLPSTTETISFRVPTGERDRLRLSFSRQGLTLAEGLKKAVYEYVAKLEGKQ